MDSDKFVIIIIGMLLGTLICVLSMPLILLLIVACICP